MPTGPGRYDAEATMVREMADAEAVIVLVIGGNRGDGFSVQTELGVSIHLTALLRKMADEIDAALTLEETIHLGKKN